MGSILVCKGDREELQKRRKIGAGERGEIFCAEDGIYRNFYKPPGGEHNRKGNDAPHDYIFCFFQLFFVATRGDIFYNAKNKNYGSQKHQKGNKQIKDLREAGKNGSDGDAVGYSRRVYCASKKRHKKDSCHDAYFLCHIQYTIIHILKKKQKSPTMMGIFVLFSASLLLRNLSAVTWREYG